MTVDGIECTRAYKRFHYASVNNTFVYPMAEIEQVVEWPFLLTGLNDSGYCRFSCSFYCPQAVSYGLLIYRDKAITGQVDIGRQDNQPIGNAILKKYVYLVRIIHVGRQGGRHEFRRIMRFQVGGLESYQGIRGCV